MLRFMMSILIAASFAAAPAYAEDLQVPAGTKLLVRTTSPIDSNRMASGAKFTVRLESSLTAGETVVAPDGSVVYGVIVGAKKGRRIVGQSQMTVTLTDIKIDGKLVPIRATGIKAAGEKKGRQTAKKAAAGAAIGAMFGGGKGAAYGAAAGASAQLLLGGRQVSIPGNTLLEFTLADPLVVKGKAPAAAAAPATKKKPAAGGKVDGSALALEVAKVRGDNAEAILGYSWNQRTEVKSAGKTALVRLEMIRFDIDGNLQRTKMSEEPDPPSAKATKSLDQLYELRSYALPSAGELLDFLQNADIESGELIRAKGTDVLHAGDSITMWIRNEDKGIEKIEVKGKVDGDAFDALIEYRTVDGGPRNPARATVQIPARELEIRIENFSYSK